MARRETMTSKQTVFDRWWPATQSLDLISGDMRAVAGAVTELFDAAANRSDGAITAEWHDVVDVDAALQTVPYFDNVGSRLLLLPTRSEWVVLWTNNFLCGGADHFLRALTLSASLTTIHWSAHDTTTTFQPGATFHLRRIESDQLVERRVQAARTDRRWDFFESGPPLPEEDMEGYQARRVRDRMNEARVMKLLGRLGAHPWEEDWYDLPGQPVYRLERPLPPRALRRDREQVITGRPAHGDRRT